jgi:hypothetical protein
VINVKAIAIINITKSNEYTTIKIEKQGFLAKFQVIVYFCKKIFFLWKKKL